jgi:hypothetical protein
MRLYPPIYLGDSILQPGTVPGGDAVCASDAGIFRTPFLRSNIRVESAAEAGADIAALERQGRATLPAHPEDFGMTAATDKTADGSSVYGSLDSVRMSQLQRRHARASLNDGELIAGLVLGAAAGMRAIAHSVEHAAVSVASGIRAMLAQPARH